MPRFLRLTLSICLGILAAETGQELQEFRGHREVDLGSSKLDMSQVDGQMMHESLHVCPLTIPGNEPMDGKGMAQVVQSWLIPSAVRAMDTGVTTQAFLPADPRVWQ